MEPYLESKLNNPTNIYETNNSYRVFGFLVLVFISLLIVRDIGGIDVPKYAFIGIASLVFLICNISLIVAFLAFIAPLSVGVSYTFMMLISLFFIFFKSKRIDIGKVIAFPYIIIFIELINSFFSNVDTVQGYFRSIVMIVLLALLFLDKSKNFNYKFILNMYLLGFMVLTFFTLYWVTRFGSIEQFFEMGITLGNGIVEGEEGTRIFTGHNVMGLFAVMTIAVSLLLLFVKAGNKLFLALNLVLGFVMGFISTSRGFFFALILCILLYILFSVKSVKNFIKVMAVVLIFALIVSVLIQTVLNGAYLTFMDKMGMSDFSNGRIELLKYYNNLLLSNPKILMIGVGIQNYVIKCDSPESVHNAIQEVLIAWGVIGLLCVVGFFWALYQNAVRNVPEKKRQYIYLVPAIVYIFRGQLDQIFSVGPQAILMLVVCCTIALSEQIIKTEDNK